MAESLEGDPGEDADRAMDRCSFQKDQFDILVHDYRESEEEFGGSYRINSNTLLKKELLSAKHKLMKSKHFFQTLASSEAYADLLERIGLTVKSIDQCMTSSLQKLGKKAEASEEYSVTNVTLPDFDRLDMELFLNDLAETELPQPCLWTTSEREGNNQFLALLGESDILINECRDVITDLKAANKDSKE